MSGTVETVQALRYDAAHPEAFTRASVGWLPWLEPLAVDELTERHEAGLVDRGRARLDYFRLLARDPEILRARTLTDKDIFYNVAEGLPREDRELAAAAASRVNGCVFCASVHARFAAHFSGREADVDRLLAEGTPPISASAGTRSWRRPRRSPARRSRSIARTSNGFAPRGSMTSRSRTSCTAPRSSTGRIGSC